MAITKYARTVHTGSDPQRQPGQPEAAHGSPPHPAVLNPCFSSTEYCLLRLKIQKTQLAKAATSAISFCLSMRSRTGSPAVQEGEAQHTSSSPPPCRQQQHTTLPSHHFVNKLITTSHDLALPQINVIYFWNETNELLEMAIGTLSFVIIGEECV